MNKFVLVVFTMLITSNAFATRGRTDGYGGHTDRVGDTGYHWHSTYQYQSPTTVNRPGTCSDPSKDNYNCLHSGGTDVNGCHVNSKTGVYHCH